MALDSLSDLRLFRQVVASGGISAAARALHDHKNRISQRLAALEQDLGVRLAHRTTRSFRLTEEGERFLVSVEALLEAAERCESSVASPRAMEGRIRIAIRSAVTGLGIGAELSRLMKAAPGLNLQVTVVDEGADLLAGGTFECSDSQLQREVLYAGYGIGPRPAAEVRQAESTGHLERVLPAWTFAPVPIWVLGPKARLRLPRVALVVDMLKEVVARHG